MIFFMETWMYRFGSITVFPSCSILSRNLRFGADPSFWGPQTVGNSSYQGIWYQHQEILAIPTFFGWVFCWVIFRFRPKTGDMSLVRRGSPGHPEADDPRAQGEQQGGQSELAGIAGCRDQSCLWLRSWAENMGKLQDVGENSRKSCSNVLFWWP